MGYAFGVGREAPAFLLSTKDGMSVSLAAYRGDWFPIVVFVPGGCGPEQLKPLDEAADRLWGLRGQLIGVCLQSASSEERPCASEVSFPLVCDNGSVASAYGVRIVNGVLTPVAFIVDRAGKIVWTGEGRQALDPVVLETALRQIAR